MASTLRNGADKGGQDWPSPDGWSPQKAALALLCAAAWADDTVRLEEEATIDSLVNRTWTLKSLRTSGMPTQLFDALVADVAERLNAGGAGDTQAGEIGPGVRKTLLEAVAHLPRQEGMAAAIFAQCCDVVYADREAHKAEATFLGVLRQALDLDAHLAGRIDAVIRLKNPLDAEAAAAARALDEADARKQRARRGLLGFLFAPRRPRRPPLDNGPWPPERAVLAVLSLAVWADHVVALAPPSARNDDPEDERLSSGHDGPVALEAQLEADALAQRTRPLHHLSAGQVAAHVEAISALINTQGPGAVLERALADLPADAGMREALFAQCADIVYADRAITGAEQGFLEHLALRLDIDPALAEEVRIVIAMKNRW